MIPHAEIALDAADLTVGRVHVLVGFEGSCDCRILHYPHVSMFFFRRQKYLESYPEFRIQGWQWTNSLPASVLRWLGVSDLYLRHLCVHITVTANHWPRKRIVAQVTNWLAHGFIGAVLSIVFFKLSITIFGLEEESFFSKFFAPKRGDSTYWYSFTGQGNRI